jgi:polygalacturonase
VWRWLGAEFRVTDFGARGDGATVDTAAIQKALDASAAARSTVVFRPGVYLAGTFINAHIRTAAASRIALRDSRGVTGLEER